MQVHPQSKLFSELKDRTQLKKDEFLVVTYMQLGACVKYLVEPFEIITNVEKLDSSKKIKFIALVICDREIELKVFTRETEWEYFTYLDDGSARERLEADPATMISILNYKGDNILNLKTGERKRNIKKTISFLKEL